jgi:ppGpp synthetase/RelA/SpoT-type nucleotidyltranferase
MATKQERAVQEYERLRPTYARFAERMAELLDTLISESDVKVHTIERRAKEVASFKEKLARPGKRYGDPIHEISDLCGVRIIAYYQEDVITIAQLIRAEFLVDEAESTDKARELDVNEFGYLSLHFVVSLVPPRSTLKEWKPFTELTAELQVRTVLQHAWAAISHALQYKREEEIEAVVARRLYRLSGLLELADEEFSTIRRQRTELQSQVSDQIDRGDRNLAIDRTTVNEYIRTSELAQRAWQQMLAAGFKDDSAGDDDLISSLIAICDLVGIDSLADLERAIVTTKRLHLSFFKAVMKGEDAWLATPAFALELIVLLAHRNELTLQRLLDAGWSDEVASKVLAAANSVKKGGAS